MDKASVVLLCATWFTVGWVGGALKMHRWWARRYDRLMYAAATKPPPQGDPPRG
jgi:hypothetical protein